MDIRIQSILSQTFQEFEIIILDDCSTDNSRDVIEKYRTNPKVTQVVYNEKNSGSTFVQWSKGFELAKGEYIWIAESDDFCDQTLLECLVNNISSDKNNVIAFCKSQFVDSTGKKIGPFLQQEKNKNVKGKHFIFFCMVTENRICNASSAIFRKDALIDIPKDYMSYKAAGDKLFWIEIARKGRVAIIGAPLNYFRQHAVKVSPKKQYDGTVYREEYDICYYLREIQCVKVFLYPFVKNHYINQIYRCELESENLRTELLQLWNVSMLNNKKLSFLIDGIYRKTLKLIFSLFT